MNVAVWWACCGAAVLALAGAAPLQVAAAPFESVDDAAFDVDRRALKKAQPTYYASGGSYDDGGYYASNNGGSYGSYGRFYGGLYGYNNWYGSYGASYDFD
jgi:hypothetical protein